MNISIGYILGHVFEYILFIYFANTSFYPRKSYVISSIISLFGYVALFAIGILGIVPLSVFLFFIVNTVLLKCCYNIKLKNALFYSIILDMLSAIGEYIFIYISGIDISNLSIVTDQQALLVSAEGKLIYLIGVIILKRFAVEKTRQDNEIQIILAVIPLMTILCLTLMMKIEMSNHLFTCICIIFLIINFVSVYINEKLNDKNVKLKVLQEEYNKNKAELSEYQLLAEKYESTRIMRHDFRKQLEVLKEMIAADNIRAKEYMQQIRFSQRELDYAQYTDNKILNILLAQKVKECHEHGIEIHIHSVSPVLSFISDIDTVAIFSNMIDNAIEAAEKADIKEIYVDLYTVNGSYSAVKIENYTDKEPVVLNGLLRTQKKNTDIHGMGVKSINNALKKYGSELTWTYDRKRKYFRAAAVIHVPGEKNNV